MLRTTGYKRYFGRVENPSVSYYKILVLLRSNTSFSLVQSIKYYVHAGNTIHIAKDYRPEPGLHPFYLFNVSQLKKDLKKYNVVH